MTQEEKLVSIMDKAVKNGFELYVVMDRDEGVVGDDRTLNDFGSKQTQITPA